MTKDEAHHLQQAACLLVGAASDMHGPGNDHNIVLVSQAASRTLACLQVLWRIWAPWW